MIQTYHRTPAFLHKMGPVLAYFMYYMALRLLDHIESSDKQKAKYDYNDVLKLFDFAEIEEQLNILTDQDEHYKWWIPIMDKAIKEFIEADLTGDGDLGSVGLPCLTYDLPYLRTLTARVMELCKSMNLADMTLVSLNLEDKIDKAKKDF